MFQTELDERIQLNHYGHDAARLVRFFQQLSCTFLLMNWEINTIMHYILYVLFVLQGYKIQTKIKYSF